MVCTTRGGLPPVGGNQADAAVNAVPPPLQAGQAPAGGVFIFRLRQNAGATGNHSIRRQHKSPGLTVCHQPGFGTGETQRVGARHLVLQRGFVDIGGIDPAPE